MPAQGHCAIDRFAATFFLLREKHEKAISGVLFPGEIAKQFLSEKRLS